MSDDIILTLNDEPVANLTRHCTNCAFFAHHLSKFMPNGNGCAQGTVSKEDWQDYTVNSGCPVFQLGASPVLDPKPLWAEALAAGATLGDGLIETDEFDIDETEKAYNPNQPRLPAGQPGGGQFVSVGGQYQHPQWGKVTADRILPSGQVEVSYRNQQGIQRVRQVNATDLSGLNVRGSAQTVAPVQAAKPNPANPKGYALPPVPSRVPSPTYPAPPGSEGARVAAAIARRVPALRAVEATLRGLFPNDEVVAREKSVTSAVRDANFKNLRNPGANADPAALDDLVGSRVVFADTSALLSGAHKLRQSLGANLKWDRAFGLNDPDLRGGNRPANEGYFAVHMNTHDNVEIQLMTRRMKYFTETTHNVFDKWNLRDGAPGKIKPEFLQYMSDMGAHYSRLDSGLPSVPPPAPPLARNEGLVLATDPLDLSKELEMTDMKDSMLTNRLAKLAPAAPVPTFKDEELSALARGEEVAVNADDNHVAHLRRHLNDKGRLLGKSLRGIGGATTDGLLANLEKHILAHREMMSKNVIGR